LEDLGVDARMILTFIFKKWERGRRVWSGSRQGQVGEGAVVNAVMDLRVPFNSGNFLIKWGTVSFSGRTLLCGVRVFIWFIWPINKHRLIPTHLHRLNYVRPGTHYPHVTWAHVMLRVQLGFERRFDIESYGADSHFCHTAYVTWSHVELWSAHVPACLSYFCCRTHFAPREYTRELWVACWPVSRTVLHVRSRDVSRVTEVWICAIGFNVNSPLTSQLHA
jgi:hypothetical protein